MMYCGGVFKEFPSITRFCNKDNIPIPGVRWFNLLDETFSVIRLVSYNMKTEDY